MKLTESALVQGEEASATDGRPPSRMPWPVLLLALYLSAITIFGKGPTYLGYPPLYWGELVMLLMLGWVYLRELPKGGLGGLGRLATLCSVFILLFMVTGAVHTALSYRSWGMVALRDAAVWYYATFFFLGLYVTGLPRIADKIWKWLVWTWVLAMIWWILCRLTNHWPIRVSPPVPWRGVPLFGGSGSENYMHMFLGAVLIVLGLAGAKSSLPRKVLSVALVCLAAGVLYTGQGRGYKVAVVLALLLGMLITIHARPPVWPTGRMFFVVAALAVVLALAAILAGPGGILRIGRLRRFDEVVSTAAEGTAYWRRQWWANIVNELHRTNPVFGLGFGPNLGKMNPYLEQDRQSKWPVRSPHNYNVTILARMGYYGLALWLMILSLGLGRLLVRIRRGQTAGRFYTRERRKELTFWLIMLSATWINASFGVLMEGPVLGIWFWFALGFATGRGKGPDGLEPLPGRAEENGPRSSDDYPTPA